MSITFHNEYENIFLNRRALQSQHNARENVIREECNPLRVCFLIFCFRFYPSICFFLFLSLYYYFFIHFFPSRSIYADVYLSANLSLFSIFLSILGLFTAVNLEVNISAIAEMTCQLLQ